MIPGFRALQALVRRHLARCPTSSCQREVAKFELSSAYMVLPRSCFLGAVPPRFPNQTEESENQRFSIGLNSVVPNVLLVGFSLHLAQADSGSRGPC